jgi:1-pyrroline-5-carboxylate dehydrogenase
MIGVIKIKTMIFPKPNNEPVFEYKKGDVARIALEEELQRLIETRIDIPLKINGKVCFEGLETENLTPPFAHQKVIAKAAIGNASHVHLAIESALKAKDSWEAKSFEERASIFLKAADLISTKYRPLMNAATMIGQSKNAYQSEIDAVCELVDFLRFNVYFAEKIFEIQPDSSEFAENSMEYRALEGFVLAITPFNFTAIASNLCCAPALFGNVVVWKPAKTQLYSAHFTLQILEEAGLPPGVINMINVDGPTVSEIALAHPEFSGLHFTGSTDTFEHLWKMIGNNLSTYKTYPRIVGETGGKDFILADETANVQEVSTAIIRGSFEFQGQKCSAASRVYLPREKLGEYENEITKALSEIKTGSPLIFNHFVNAVIDKKSFNRIKNYIDYAKSNANYTLIHGGNYDDKVGYFIEPTVFICSNSKGKLLEEEIFGPVVTIYLYDKKENILEIIDSTSPYALTGAVFSKDESFIKKVKNGLKNAAGNFYINDKPTGAVVNQQPFGGARKSGTNDKAGSMLNLLRWVSPRTIKRNPKPPSSYEYPFMD